MKRNKLPLFRMLFLAGYLILLSSCEKFIEENPRSFVSVANYYKTESDAIESVNSIYGYLNSTSSGTLSGVYKNSLWATMGVCSEEMANGQFGAVAWDQLSSFSHNAQNGTLLEIWQLHYKTITIANIAIERIPPIVMNEALKARLLGEARFLRALIYYNLVRMFGEIPLVLKEVEPVRPMPAKVADIYAQILADLNAAEPALPVSYNPGNGLGRATKGAAQALLSKVYLTLGNWSQSAEAAKKVIDSNRYGLWADFSQAFKYAARNGKEVVFSVSFGDASGAISFWEVGSFNTWLLPRELAAEGVNNTQGFRIPTQYIYNQFDPLDRRREVTFITEVKNANGTPRTIAPHIQKYWDRVNEPKGAGSKNDFQVIRYAEVLLNYAEAVNESGNSALALQYVNMIRKRARFNGVTDANTLPDLTGLTTQQTRDAILRERSLEFVSEGHRWFDLTRTKKLAVAVSAAKSGVTPQERHYLFPIPQREIDVNPNLKQNSGY